jgi:outer membrane lipoprotein-sorting protein
MKEEQFQANKSVRTRTLALVAAGVLAAAGITGLVARGAAAEPVLPPLTPAELLGKVAAAQTDGLSATFEQRSDLGLPALPADLGDTGDELSSILALATGSHTVRVWLAEPDKAKVALVDGASESSLTRNGNDVWAWSSTKQEAVHSTLKAPTSQPSGAPTSPTSPTQAIKDLLDRLEPTTDVATSGTGYVAGRAVYQLVLTPRDDASLVAAVRVSVDAERFVPLGLRVIADDGQDAITVAATSVEFAVPAASVFDFQPPAGVTVTEQKDDASPAKPDTKAAAKPRTLGTGWVSVVVAEMPKADTPAKAGDPTKALLESLPVVSGDWGKGRLLSTVLVNAVITDDGRVAVGSVVPERLYAALTAR